MKKILSITGIGIALAIVFLYGMQAFYDNYQLVSPIVIHMQSPVQRKVPQRTPVVPYKGSTKGKSYLPTSKRNGSNNNGIITAGMTTGQVVLEAVKTVRFHESSNGRVTGLNKYCHDQGMTNSIGYDPQHNFCFKNDLEETVTLTNWFRNCLRGSSIEGCLGVYSNNSYTTLAYE